MTKYLYPDIITKMNKVVYKLILVVFFYSCILSCEKNKEIRFYIENESESDSSVQIDIWLDGKIVTTDTIINKDFSPNYQFHKVIVNSGDHFLKVKTTSNICEFDTISVDSNLFVFISYKYKVWDQSAYKFQKEEFEALYPKSVFPDKKFVFDSIAIPRSIEIYVTDVMPTLQ